MRKIGNKAMSAASSRMENGNRSGGIKDIFDVAQFPHKVEWASFTAGQDALFDIIPYVIESKNDPDVVNAGLRIGDLAAFMNVGLHVLGPDNAYVACPKNFRKNCTCEACEQKRKEWDIYKAANHAPKSKEDSEAAKIPKAYAAKMRSFFWIRPYEFRNGKWLALDKIQLMDISTFFFTKAVTALIQKKATFGTGNSGDVIANFSVAGTPTESGFGKALDFRTGMTLEPRIGPDITETQEELAFSLSKYLKITTNEDIQAVMFGEESDPEQDQEPEHSAPVHRSQPAQETQFDDNPPIDFGDSTPAPKTESAKQPTQSNKVDVSKLKFRDPCPVNPEYAFGRNFDRKPECESCQYRKECEAAE